VTLELCQQLGLPIAERQITPEGLRQAAGIFLTLSSLGVVEADELDGLPLAVTPLSAKLRRAYEQLLTSELG
jgi:branched-subunit amino acid aminotransferase/4-amino-4-deoxychorismate lyase